MEQLGARLLVDSLKSKGVRHVFGLVGAQTMPFWEEIVRDPAIKPLFARHEACLSYGCQGYTKVSGKPGVCLSEPGPGALNLLPGVAAAQCHSLPMIAITTQIPFNMIGRSVVHDCDLAPVFRPVVKAQFVIGRAAEIPAVIDEAFTAALSGRPGPVHLIITSATLNQPAEPEQVKRRQPAGAPAGLESKLEEAIRMLSTARQPIIYAGYGVVEANAAPELRLLAEKLSAPVITSLPARGLLPETHPLCFGMITFDGAQELLDGADVCLVLGTRFSEWSTDGWSYRLPRNTVQVDLDPDNFGRNYPTTIGLEMDAALALRRLTDALPHRASGPLAETARLLKARHARELDEFMGQPPRFPLHPLWLMATLRRSLPPDAIIVTDSSSSQMWSCEPAFTVTEPRTLLQSETFLEVGSGLLMAIGAKLAAPDKTVVAIVGDGAMMYQLGDIATAVANKLGILVIIFDDGYYNIPRACEDEFYGGPNIGVELNNPDFAALARSFGADGYRLRSPDELGPLVQRNLAAVRPVLIDAPIDRTILPDRIKKRLEQRKRDPQLRLGRKD